MQSSESNKTCSICFQKLSTINEPKFAKLYGVFFNNTTILLTVQVVSELENDLEYCLPTEFDLYGLVSISDDQINHSEIIKKLHHDIDVTDNPIFLSFGVGKTDKITSYVLIHGQLQSRPYTVVSEQEIYENLMYVRLTGSFSITCNAERSCYDEAILELRNTATSGKLAFNIPKTPVYLLGNESETYGNTNSEPIIIGDVCKHSNDSGIETATPYIINMTILKKVYKDNVIGDKEQHAPICFVTKSKLSLYFNQQNCQAAFVIIPIYRTEKNCFYSCEN